MNAHADQPPYFADDHHALDSGVLLGFLMSKGIEVRPEIDDLGNYKPTIKIDIGANPLDTSAAPHYYIWVTVEPRSSGPLDSAPS